MSSIMRQRRGLKSAISILLSEGVGSNTHILSARRRTTPPCPLRRGSGFVQSSFANQSLNSAKVVLGQDNQIEDRRIVARRAEQDEAMPDRVLEAQPLPGMEDHTEAV